MGSSTGLSALCGERLAPLAPSLCETHGADRADELRMLGTMDADARRSNWLRLLSVSLRLNVATPRRRTGHRGPVDIRHRTGARGRVVARDAGGGSPAR